MSNMCMRVNAHIHGLFISVQLVLHGQLASNLAGGCGCKSWALLPDGWICLIFPVTMVSLSSTGQDSSWYIVSSRVLHRWQTWKGHSPDYLLTMSLQPTQTRGCMFPARGVPMHLEGEGIFPWGPSHVSLPYMVSEAPSGLCFFLGGQGERLNMGCKIMNTV